MQFLDTVLRNDHGQVIYSDAALELDFSYVDAAKFALMRQRAITEAATFDHHFLVAGFVLTTGAQ